MTWVIVVVGTVCRDEEKSAWGRVQLRHCWSRKRWWHHFKTEGEWREFHALWSKLEKPFELQLRRYAKSNRWRAPWLTSVEVKRLTVVTKITGEVADLPPGQYAATVKSAKIEGNTVCLEMEKVDAS